MPYRKEEIIEHSVCHICTKSIAGYTIFNSQQDYERITKTLAYYTFKGQPGKFSYYLRAVKEGSESRFLHHGLLQKIVEIIAYCIMPTHIHLVLEQLQPEGVSKYMNLILKSYSQYFNTRHKRKGPLWESRFRSVEVETDDQLMHLTRYVHLNPVTAGIINSPEEWEFSSYRQYAGIASDDNKFCDYSKFFEIDAKTYCKFAEDQIDYQRELAKIKKIVME